MYNYYYEINTSCPIRLVSMWVLHIFFCCSFRGYPVAADFLEAHASEQERFEEIWLQEAEKIRASAWGGHNAIIAYSYQLDKDPVD